MKTIYLGERECRAFLQQKGCLREFYSLASLTKRKLEFRITYELLHWHYPHLPQYRVFQYTRSKKQVTRLRKLLERKLQGLEYEDWYLEWADELIREE